LIYTVMQQPNTFIISMANSAQLLKTQLELTKKGWSFNLHPAVDGNTVTDLTWLEYGIAKPVKGKLPYRPGAQGCLLSHFQLWQHCIAINTPIIILEHDALVTESWDTSIEFNGSDVIKLCVNQGSKVNEDTGHWGKWAGAYLINPIAASQLVNQCRTETHPADKIIGDRIVAWSWLDRPMFTHNKAASTTSPTPSHLRHLVPTKKSKRCLS